MAIKAIVFDVVGVLAHVDFVSNEFTPLPYAQQLFEQLLAHGYQVYLLSNMTDQARRRFIVQTDFHQKATGALFACEAGMQKPEADFFNLFLKMYDLKADECLFIDDQEENVSSAKKLGFHTLLAQDPRLLQVKIARILRLVRGEA